MSSTINLSVRHRAMHEQRPYTVWQGRDPLGYRRFTATFDRDNESIEPRNLIHATMGIAVDAMLLADSIIHNTSGAVS